MNITGGRDIFQRAEERTHELEQENERLSVERQGLRDMVKKLESRYSRLEMLNAKLQAQRDRAVELLEELKKEVNVSQSASKSEMCCQFGRIEERVYKMAAIFAEMDKEEKDGKDAQQRRSRIKGLFYILYRGFKNLRVRG